MRFQSGKSNGQALVPVLFVVFILTAMAVTVSAIAKREVKASGTYLHDVQQYYAAKGAINFVAAQLQQATNGGTTLPQLTPPQDTDANGWTQLGDAWYKVDIIDTSSRLNINTANVATLTKLPVLQSDPNLGPAIIDWRDADDTPTTNQNGSGAESDYYQTLSPPYSAKNSPFDSVEELLLVRGFSPPMLYGATVNDPNSTQPTGDINTIGGGRSGLSRQAGGGQGAGNSTAPAVDTSSSATPLCELITTYSRELNVSSDGTKRVNIRTANQTDLQNTGMSANLARTLIQTRTTSGGLTSVSDLMNIPGFTRQVMQQIGDKITVTDSQYRNGVVNINTAPAEVLATIPGVDSTIYNTVIQARQSGTVFTGINDIFQLNQLNRQQLQKLVDYVCTKSSVYLLRVRVRVTGSQKVFAAQALVELQAPAAQTASGGGAGGASAAQSDATAATSTTAKVLQWREIPRYPGWSSWGPAPNYYSNTTGSGGTFGN